MGILQSLFGQQQPQVQPGTQQAQPAAVDTETNPGHGLLFGTYKTPEQEMAQLALFSQLASGRTPQDQLNFAPTLIPFQQAMAQKQAAVDVKNKTVAVLQQKYPDLAASVLAGAVSPNDATMEMFKRDQQAKEDAKPKFIAVNGRLVQTNGADKPTVVQDFSDPMAGLPADAKTTAYWQGHPDEYKIFLQQEKDKAALRNNGDNSVTPLQRDLAAAGLTPGTPEYQQAILNARKLGAKPGQSSPKLSEDQSKNVGFLIRARNAEAVLSDPAVLNDPKNAADPNAIPATNDTQGLSRWNQFANALPFGTGNSIISSDAKSYNQAKLNFITAALRKESGAAISQGEYDNADKTYFPQPGDDRKQIDQKRQSREDVIKGFEISAGPGAEIANQTAQSAAQDQSMTPANNGVTKSGIKFTVQP